MLTALAVGCASGPIDTLVDSTAEAPSVTGEEDASLVAAQKHWRKAMAKVPLPKEGCFQVTHPSMTWVEVPCVSPPDVPFMPAIRGGAHGTMTVGGGVDYSARVSGTISWAEGSFLSVDNVTSVSSSNYSLQLNTNSFVDTWACRGAQDPTDCLAWQQFIYASGRAFMQYWLIAYDNPCPSGWTTKVDGPYRHCYRNSSGSVSVPALPAPRLADVALIAVAGSAGDSVAMSVGGTIYSYTMGSSLVRLYANWNTAEFGIFGGSGNSSRYDFNSNSSIVVQTLTDTVTPTTSAPACVIDGYTGETNNLTLVPNSCCPIGGSLPGIQFMLSNASPLPSPQACPLMPLDPSWSSTRQPFDRVVVGSDVGGKTLLSCRANYQGGVHPGKTRTDWNYCDIGWGGRERKVMPYETLVPAWIDATGGSVPPNALPFGTDGSGGPSLYACRGYPQGIDGVKGLQVGKVSPALGGCRVAWSAFEIGAPVYQVLTATIPVTIQSVKNAAPPSGALVGGYDANNQPLYVCQAEYGGGLVPGKTRSDWKSCVIPLGGGVRYVSNYNVLVPSFKAPPPASMFQAGWESNGTTLGVCRANYQNSMQVGKYLTTSGTSCNFGFGTNEIRLTSGFEVLTP
jgi:hypothetical protein